MFTGKSWRPQNRALLWLTTGSTAGLPSGLAVVLLRESSHQAGDLVTVFFQREVAGIEQVELNILQVPLVGMRSLGRENLVVLAPDDQRRWLMFAEVSLPRRVKR